MYIVNLLFSLLVPDSSCSSSERRCADGVCIPASSWCNQIIDCADASDEKSCSKISMCEGASRSHFWGCVCVCVSLNVWNTRLIVLSVFPDSTDCMEYYRLGSRASNSDRFLSCNSTSLCVHPSWICDGANDCGDYADEIHCHGRNAFAFSPPVLSFSCLFVFKVQCCHVKNGK